MLRLNNENEPTSLDPPIGFNNVSWQPLNNIMEGLTRLGKDNKEHPFPGVHEVFRRNGIAICPFGVITDIEGICQLISGHLPAFRHGRFGFIIFSEPRQSFHDVIQRLPGNIIKCPDRMIVCEKVYPATTVKSKSHIVNCWLQDHRAERLKQQLTAAEEKGGLK